MTVYLFQININIIIIIKNLTIEIRTTLLLRKTFQKINHHFIVLQKVWGLLSGSSHVLGQLLCITAIKGFVYVVSKGDGLLFDNRGLLNYGSFDWFLLNLIIIHFLSNRDFLFILGGESEVAGQFMRCYTMITSFGRRPEPVLTLLQEAPERGFLLGQHLKVRVVVFFQMEIQEMCRGQVLPALGAIEAVQGVVVTLELGYRGELIVAARDVTECGQRVIAGGGNCNQIIRTFMKTLNRFVTYPDSSLSGSSIPALTTPCLRL